MVARFPDIGNRALSGGVGATRVNPGSFGRTAAAGQNLAGSASKFAFQQAGQVIQDQAHTARKERVERERVSAEEKRKQEKALEDAARRERATERIRIAGEAAAEYEGILQKAGQEAGPGGSGLSAGAALGIQGAQEKYLEGIDDPELAASVEQDLLRMRFRTEASAREAEATRMASHRRDTIDSSLGNLLTPIVSRPEMLDDVRAQGDQLIDAAEFLTPEEKTQVKQSWADQAVMSALSTRVTEDPHDVIDELNDGNYDDDITPASKLKLINQSKAEIKRRVAEQKAQSNERSRILEKQVKAASDVMKAGYEYRDIDKLRRAVSGTDLGAELDFHMQVADARQEHALLPVGQQIEMMRQITSQPQTAASLEVIEALGPVTAEANKAVQSDKVLEYATDHGVIELEPIDYGNPASWGHRIERAGTAAQVMGVERANILTEPEVAQLTEFVDSLPADEKIEWMSGMQGQLGRDGFRQVQDVFLKEDVAPGLDIAADMLGRSEKNLPAARRLLQAMEIDEKSLPIDNDVKKAAKDAATSSFNNGIGEVLLQQSDILSSDASRLKFMAQMSEATQKMAVGYAASGRGKGWFSNSGSSAYEDMFGDYQTVNDDDAVLFVEPSVGDVDDIADGLRAIRQRAMPEALEFQRPVFHAQYGEAQGDMMFDEYVSDMQDDGVWVNGNGGAVLVDPVQGAVIAKPDGTPYRVRFEDALRALEE